MAGSIIESSKMTRLLTVLEEATRSTAEGVQFFVEPAEDALRRATSKRHHIVFGGVALEKRRSCERRPLTWAVRDARSHGLTLRGSKAIVTQIFS